MIDFACRHIWADSFDCGNSHLNAGLAATLSKLPDPADITVLISHDDDDIVNAYSTVVDVLLKLDEAGRDERCFLVAALG